MKINFTLFILVCAFNASSQRCATVDYLKTNSAKFSNSLTTPVSPVGTRDTLASEIIIVPVVVHILYNNASQNISNDQVLSQIVSLNADYRRLNADTMKTPSLLKSKFSGLKSFKFISYKNNLL